MPFWPFVRERRNQPIGICHFCVRETQRTARSATPQAVLPPNLRPPLHPVPHTGSVLPPGTICCWICITDLLSYHPTTGVILPSSVLPAPITGSVLPPGALCCWIHITPPPFSILLLHTTKCILLSNLCTPLHPAPSKDLYCLRY